MMEFHPSRGGYRAQADETERRLLRGLASDVIQMLGFSDDEWGAASDASSTPASDEDVFASYEAEFEAIEANAAAQDAPVPAEENHTPMDEAVLRLLPDMNEDPELAGELRGLTERSIAAKKAEHLGDLRDALQDNIVWVPNEKVTSILSALNDIRLVVAVRLDIRSEEREEAIQSEALTMTGATGRPVENTEELLVVFYAMISWWQESLVRAVRNKQLRG